MFSNSFLPLRLALVLLFCTSLCSALPQTPDTVSLPASTFSQFPEIEAPAWVTELELPDPDETGFPWTPRNDLNYQPGLNVSDFEQEVPVRAVGGVVTTGAASTAAANTHDGIDFGVDRYVLYTGDGTVAQGWPAKSKWVSFSSMFASYKTRIYTSCKYIWGYRDVTQAEMGQIWNAIQDAATKTKVDHRLILAVMMQESAGCVRVHPTVGFWKNLGLMQSANGVQECNDGRGNIDYPCSTQKIFGMIHEGTGGTTKGDGLAQCMNRAAVTDVSAFYKAARLYNSGSIPANGDLSGPSSSTRCYASDIANRFTGWVKAANRCNL